MKPEFCSILLLDDFFLLWSFLKIDPVSQTKESSWWVPARSTKQRLFLKKPLQNLQGIPRKIKKLRLWKHHACINTPTSHGFERFMPPASTEGPGIDGTQTRFAKLAHTKGTGCPPSLETCGAKAPVHKAVPLRLRTSAAPVGLGPD